MRILGTIIKTARAIAAMVYFGSPDDLFGTITIFAGAYGLITWYIFNFTNGGIFEGIGEGGLIVGLLLTLCMPALVLVIPLFILEAILPGEIGDIIYGIVVLAACVGCVVSDFVHIIRLFKPDSRGGVLE